MSAVYFDKHGFARYVEDSRTGPQPAEVVTGLERRAVDLERIWPIDIVAAERAHHDKGAEEL